MSQPHPIPPCAWRLQRQDLSGAATVLALALATGGGSVAVWGQTVTRTPPPDVPVTRGTVDLSGFNAAIGSARPPALGPTSQPHGERSVSAAGQVGTNAGTGTPPTSPTTKPPPPRKPPTVAELAGKTRATTTAKEQADNRAVPTPVLGSNAPAAFTPRPTPNAGTMPPHPPATRPPPDRGVLTQPDPTEEAAAPVSPQKSSASSRPNGPRLVSPARPPDGGGRWVGPTPADPPTPGPTASAPPQSPTAPQRTPAGGAASPPEAAGADESLQHVAEKLLAAMAEVNERQRLEAEKARAQAAQRKKGAQPAKANEPNDTPKTSTPAQDTGKVLRRAPENAKPTNTQAP